jgi:hypothetical protein
MPNRPVVRSWFTLALRIIGIWELVTAAGFLMTAFDMSVGYYRSSGNCTLGGMMVHTFGHFFLAAWLLKGAPKIAAFFYPDLPPIDKTSDDKPSDSDTPSI